MEPLKLVRFKQLVYLREVASTNEYATNKLSNNDPNINICLYTFNQTLGRGQIGRFWYSGSSNNLSSSFKWQSPKIQVKDQFLINMAFALAIYDFLSLFITQKLSIKWPNDLYVGDQKIAGLLIQNTLRADSIASCVLGVGINVNESEFPKELPNPVSISQLTGQSYDLLQLQKQLIACVETRLSQLSLGSGPLRQSYLKVLYRKDEAHYYNIEGQELLGSITGLSPEGKLILSINGETRAFNFRELRYVI